MTTPPVDRCQLIGAKQRIHGDGAGEVLVRANGLGDDPSRPRYIVTEPGIGYRLLTE